MVTPPTTRGYQRRVTQPTAERRRSPRTARDARPAQVLHVARETFAGDG